MPRTCPPPTELERFAAGLFSSDERGALLDHAAECAECHAMMAVLGEARVVQRVDRYELLRVLGRGATGVVYAARDPELGRDIAVKLLKPSVPSDRLRREALALGKLAHPNVVRIYDVGEHEGQVFIAMEMVRGQNLRAWLADAALRDPARIVEVVLEAGRGLAAAHRAGLVHRDFKPDNVLIADDGGVLVGDFGLARLARVDPSPPRPRPDPEDVDAPLALAETLQSGPGALGSDDWRSLTSTGALVGTPAYMAPEQATEEATEATDQFAFAVTAWEACFGARPFDGASLGEIWAAVRAGTLREITPSRVPRGAAIAKALRRALAADPAARYPSMNELLHALAPPVRRRRGWPVVAAGLAAAGAVYVAWPAAPAITCDDAGEAIAQVWTPEVRRAIGAHGPPSLVEAIDRYAAAWSAQRIEACRATHVRHEQLPEVLAQRAACLDRARTSLVYVTQRLQLLAGTERSDLVVDALPALEECVRGGAASPSGIAFDAVRGVLESEVLQLELACANQGAVAAGELAAVSRRADALGDPRLSSRIHALEARSAAWAGRLDEAEALLRRAVVRAEADADDRGRARAVALLARLLATRRPDEAEALAHTARAALVRAGGDPAIELAILEAEVAIALERKDPRAAVALQRRVVEQARARYGTATATAMAQARLGEVLTRAGDPAGSRTEFDESDRIATEVARATGQWTGEDDVLMAPALERVQDGMFDDAIALARRQVAIASKRRMTDMEARYHEAIAIAYEMKLDDAAAYDAWRDAERVWKRPYAAFAGDGGLIDRVDVDNGRFAAASSAATLLVDLGRAAEAVTALEALLAQPPATVRAAELALARRRLGVALVEAGQDRRGAELLQPIEDHAAELFPFARAVVRFALARASWRTGGLAVRPRARAWIADAERDLARAEALVPTRGELRLLPVRIAALRTRIAAWNRDH